MIKEKGKLLYESPKVELFLLGEGLNLMKHFSSTGGADDWNGGGLLESELEELGELDDWGDGGGLGYD